MRYLLLPILSAAGTAVALAPTSLAAVDRPLTVERVAVLPAEGVGLRAGGRYGIGREAAAGLAYDNARIGPLGARFGLGDRVEVGGHLSADINMADDTGAPDETGLDGLTVYGKIAANDFLAITAGLTAGGANDVGPVPNDGLDFFVNIPMQRPLGAGRVYGELGMRVQDDAIGGTFLNYGLGYSIPVAEQFAVTGELVGKESNIRFRDGNTMSLQLGGNFPPEPTIDVAPYLGRGVFDAAPTVSLGAAFEMRL